LHCFAEKVKYDVVYPFVFAENGLHGFHLFLAKVDFTMHVVLNV
jgi:hypothetical protein